MQHFLFLTKKVAPYTCPSGHPTMVYRWVDRALGSVASSRLVHLCLWPSVHQALEIRVWSRIWYIVCMIAYIHKTKTDTSPRGKWSPHRSRCSKERRRRERTTRSFALHGMATCAREASLWTLGIPSRWTMPWWSLFQGRTGNLHAGR